MNNGIQEPYYAAAGGGRRGSKGWQDLASLTPTVTAFEPTKEEHSGGHRSVRLTLERVGTPQPKQPRS